MIQRPSTTHGKKSYKKPEIYWGLVFAKNPVPEKHRMAFLNYVATIPREHRLNPGRTEIDYHVIESMEELIDHVNDVAKNGGTFRSSFRISDGRMDEKGESPCIAKPFKKRGRWLGKRPENTLKIVRDAYPEECKEIDDYIKRVEEEEIPPTSDPDDRQDDD